jgi:tetratricopeptide (TPR) repeat protein
MMTSGTPAARKAVTIDHSDANAHCALALFDLFYGRHEEVPRRLRRALDLDSSSVFARGYLGTSFGLAGNYEAALPYCNAAIPLSEPIDHPAPSQGLAGIHLGAVSGSRPVRDGDGRGHTPVAN